MSLVIKRVKEISRKKKKSGWRSRRQLQMQAQAQLERLEEEKEEEKEQAKPDVGVIEEEKEVEEEAACVAVPPPHHKRPLLGLTDGKEEPNGSKRRCRPCRSCRGRVNTTNQFEFIEPAPKNYLKHLHLFAIIEGGPGKRIVFYKKDGVEGPCCAAQGGRCDRYRARGQHEQHRQAQNFYAHAVENVNLATPRGYERFSEPDPPPPPPPPPQFIWTKYGPDNRLSMIYLWNRYDPYLADSKWRRKYGEQMALLRHRNYLAGNRGGFVHPPYN